MKVSLNTVKQFIDFELLSTGELVKRINARLGGVEEVIDLGGKYKDVKIVKVVECEKHPNADKLSVCMVDAGTGELVQVVCGANNVHADMWAAWLPPKSTVPATYDDAEPFVLGARELRGIVSNGMLASARELGIGDDHSGIVDITDADVPKGKTLAPGASFAEVFGLDDVVIDIENKMFTHRPDLFGQLGVAREIAGIFGRQFASPEWYVGAPKFENISALPLEIFNDASEKSPRFMAVAIKDVTVGQSPLWLKCALVTMGGKPINNIVDVTNYIMLLTAQPTHAYDYDKLHGARLGVRMAKPGESAKLLNGKTYTLNEDDIVIADGKGVVGLAGVMGGFDSEVTNETKNIVLEVANFNMYAVRKSSMRHGVFTDALTRFNKGQSPLQNDRILNLLMMSVNDAAGGSQASDVYDTGRAKPPRALTVSSNFINQRLGLNLKTSDIKMLLLNVEMKIDVDAEGKSFKVEPPFWRTDIDEPEDIVEEVGRLYGFDKLPRELPTRSLRPAAKNQSRELKWSLRQLLLRAGANEVLTYSFVHERILNGAGQDKQQAYKLSNAISPDLQYYRLSVVPSLASKVHANIKAGFSEFALFEISKSHDKPSGLNDEGVPIEHEPLALVYASKSPHQGSSFYKVKSMLEFMAGNLGIDLAYEPLGDSSTSPVAAPFEPKRSAIVSDATTGRYIGVVGEFKRQMKMSFKLPDYVAGFELNTVALLEVAKQAGPDYLPLGRYPSVQRDISLRVDSSGSYQEVETALLSALNTLQLDAKLAPVGIYMAEGSKAKNITFRLTFASPEKTLTSDEVGLAMKAVEDKLKESIEAEVV